MLTEKRITLDPRLSMIAEMVGRCLNYADIGCDHGRLGAFLLQRNWVNRALLMDISGPSLEKARKLIAKLGLEARTRFIVCDGADALDESVDVVVIAGMGGATAAQIVENERGKFGAARLILQVNVYNPELRERLSKVGYMITDERIVKDGRRYYVIIQAEPGQAEYTTRERIVGPILMKHPTNELMGYAEFRNRVARKALSGAEGRQPEVEASLREEIAIWEDVLKWRQP